MLAAAAAMVLPWQRGASDTGMRGIDVNEGILVIIASVITIGLIQVELRPAWMGAGFAVAVLGRQLAGSQLPDPGIGPILGLVFAGAATVLLLVGLFTTIRNPTDGAPSAKRAA